MVAKKRESKRLALALCGVLAAPALARAQIPMATLALQPRTQAVRAASGPAKERPETPPKADEVMARWREKQLASVERIQSLLGRIDRLRSQPVAKPAAVPPSLVPVMPEAVVLRPVPAPRAGADEVRPVSASFVVAGAAPTVATIVDVMPTPMAPTRPAALPETTPSFTLTPAAPVAAAVPAGMAHITVLTPHQLAERKAPPVPAVAKPAPPLPSPVSEAKSIAPKPKAPPKPKKVVVSATPSATPPVAPAWLYRPVTVPPESPPATASMALDRLVLMQVTTTLGVLVVAVLGILTALCLLFRRGAGSSLRVEVVNPTPAAPVSH